MIQKIVIPAGGLGTRLLPVTKEMPKEMMPLFLHGKNGEIIVKPLIQIIYEKFFRFGEGYLRLFNKYPLIFVGVIQKEKSFLHCFGRFGLLRRFLATDFELHARRTTLFPIFFTYLGVFSFVLGISFAVSLLVVQYLVHKNRNNNKNSTGFYVVGEKTGICSFLIG